MKCHYEVLGVPRDADNDLLKKSYRKLALIWHPDKNPDKTEEATETFRLIQQAYDVLSDPHERAFYDRHRESILHAGEGKSPEDDRLDLFEYFNGSCYRGYGDDEKGFYTIYRDLFGKIAAEDEEIPAENGRLNDKNRIPSFGHSTSSYDDVVHPFYAYWLSYCTKSSYAWVYKYDIRDAPNRRIARAMEKENKKLRDQARKKRNEEVRALVAFVRKRDKRMAIHRKILEEKAAENAKKAEENRRKQLEDKKRILENYEESGWSAMSGMETALREMEDSLAKQFGDDKSQSDNDDSEENEEKLSAATDLYCIACDKAFKSEKAFANHENSKKHKENATFLKASMQEDEKIFLGSNNESDTVPSEEDEIEELVETRKKSKKQKGKTKKLLLKSDDEEAETLDSPLACTDELEEMKTKKQKSKKQRLKEALNQQNEQDECSREEAEEEELPEFQTSETLNEDPERKTDLETSSQGTEAVHPKSKLKGKSRSKQEDHVCITCHAAFQTRNKLFEHLKEKRHGAPKGTVISVKEQASEKTKGRRRVK